MDDYKKSIKYNAKAKIQRMINPKQEKVDSSDWKAPEPLNADIKTGMRPISRRAYKRGGKVAAKEMGPSGSIAAKRGDRIAKKSGGSADRNRPMSVDDYLNRNQKMANELREGGDKHVGGYKKGGRAKKYVGGGMPYGGANATGIPQGSGMSKVRSYLTGGFKKGGKVSKEEWEHSKADLAQDKKLAKKYGMSLEAWEKSKKDEKHDKQQSAKGLKHGGKSDHASIKKKVGYGSSAMTPEANAGMDAMKKGGRAKKMMGGMSGKALPPRLGGSPNPPSDTPARGMTRPGFQVPSRPSSGPLFGPGGLPGVVKTPKTPDMVRPGSPSRPFSGNPVASGPGKRKNGGRAKKMMGGSSMSSQQVNRAAKGDREYTMSPSEIAEAAKIAKEAELLKLKAKMAEGDEKDRMLGGNYKKGGRTERKSGGRVKKGKTNINITINAGPKPLPGAMGLDAALANGLPAGAPVPQMPPLAPPMPPMAPPMAAGPDPMGGAPMPPMGAGGPPMPLPRKAGGRVHMTAGAGSGEGRLQKRDWYGEKAPRAERKTGGRTKMTAGAGSGEGRLQKIELYGDKA